MRPFFLLALLWLLAAPAVPAQTPAQRQASLRYWEADGDSLRRLLNTQHADTARMRTLLHIVEVGGSRSAADFLKLLNETAQLARRLRRPDARAHQLAYYAQKMGNGTAPLAQCLDSVRAALDEFDRVGQSMPSWINATGRLLAELQPPDSVYVFYQTRLARYRRRGDQASVMRCYHGLGRHYVERGDYNQGISSYLRAADLASTLNRYFQVNELKVVGSFYADWGNPAKALAYLRQSLAVAATLPPKFSTKQLGFTYRGLAVAYRQLHDYPAALRYAALSQAGDPTDTTRIGAIYLPLDRALGLALTSALLLDQGRPAEAGPLLVRAQHLGDSLKLELASAQGFFELDATWARYHAARGEAGRAETEWLTAYRKAREQKQVPLQLAYLHGLADFYAQRGQAAPASRYARAALALSDSLAARQGAFQVAQYEFERADKAQQARIATFRARQQQDATQARRQRRVLWAVLGGVALLVLLGAVLWRGNRQQQRANALLSQQKAEIQAQRDHTAHALAELRTTQAQLIQKEKMASLGELTAGIAHEIQNPLNFVNNFAEVSTELCQEAQELLTAAALTPATQAELTDLLADLGQNQAKITQHGRRAAGIVRGMLEHSRTSAGERAPTDLNALCEEYLRLAYQGLRAKDKSFNAALTTDFGAGLPLVSAVGADVGRVLLNLFGNAFYAVQKRQQAGEPGYQPQVGVRTVLLNQQVRIEVTDNGTGMPEAVRGKIFQPFFTTKPTGEGTGLGLSLSHDIIAQGHGGTLSVESHEGQGTTFSVGLPVGGGA